MTFRILVLIFIFVANISSAATFSTNNIDADFDECIEAWKKGNVIWQNGMAGTRVFVHYKNRIFDIGFYDEKSAYICREKIFSEVTTDKKKVGGQEPDDFNVLEYICRSDGFRGYIPYCMNEVQSSENLLSIVAKFPKGKKVKLKELTYTGSKSGVFIETKFFPHKIPSVESLFLVAKFPNMHVGFTCVINESNSEEIKKASEIKTGVSYTVVGIVDFVGEYDWRLKNCSFKRD